MLIQLTPDHATELHTLLRTSLANMSAEIAATDSAGSRASLRARRGLGASRLGRTRPRRGTCSQVRLGSVAHLGHGRIQGPPSR
jgi:hypothetical protein